MFIIGVVILIIGLLIAVALHELGHLVPAKRFGVKVPQYFVGFGPTIWSKQVGETEYGIKAIPLGGFVRLASMLYPGSEGRKQTRKSGELTWAEEARRASAEELEAGEENRAFWMLPAWKKFIVMFSGPFVNLILSIICISIVLVGIGQSAPSNTISSVSQCVTVENKCVDDDPVSPAAQAGLQAGDTIIEWAGTPIDNWDELADAIAATDAESVQAVIERDGKQQTLTVHPTTLARPVYDEDGEIARDEQGKEIIQETPYIGVNAGYDLERQSWSAVFTTVGTLAKGTAAVVVRLPVEVWNTAHSLVTSEDRSGGVVSVVGVADMAGQITSTDVEQYSTTLRIADLLSLLASLNMALFIFNLIPLLPLDGGHMLGAIIEGIRNTWAKIRGKEKPAPFDTARFIGVTYVVAGAFLVMTVILIVADIVNPVF